MSEAGDFDPGPWTGHDFKSAYHDYDAHAGRSYADAVSGGKAKTDLLEARICTNATNPMVLWVDVTGSMGEWPKWMFSKLPYLELEAQQYLGKDLEIAFGAFGDAQCGSKYPVQIRPFTSGTDLKTRMEELVIEGGGGNTTQESSELAAVYSVHNVEMPNAISPVLVIITDEMPYDVVSPDVAESEVGVTLQGRITVEKIFSQLCQRFSVYVIRKPYQSIGDNAMNAVNQEIRNRWVGLVGADHVKDLADPKRVVDVIFGILAQQTGRLEYFREEIEGRQTPEQVSAVYKSLGDMSKAPDRLSGKSVLRLGDGSDGPKSKSLL